VDRLLLIGRADAGAVALRPERVQLHQTISEVIDEACSGGFEHRQVRLNDDDAPELAILDRRLLRHVLGNLVGNALKYSEGTVHLNVAGDADGICFDVEDEGIGIAFDDLQEAFQPFRRGSNVSDIPGTGLGLAVVKRSVDGHGGNILVERRPQGGTRFRVRLPTLGEAA
jgi:signal transduction histidine kinase